MRSQKSDTWYLETAFYILAATIVWLVWRRLLYGPTWWLVWFPLRTFFRGWKGVITTLMSSGSGAEVSSVVTGSVTAATSIAASSVVHRKATRGAKVPGVKPPSVNVGGGGRGAPMKGPNVPGAVKQGDGESVLEQVGRIVDESKDAAEAVAEESTDDALKEGEQPNPQKRMWEEEAEAPKEAAGRSKDEL